ncbi:MAG TPA: DUF1307 domain-containing protein [Enteractinococcus sp.]
MPDPIRRPQRTTSRVLGALLAASLLLLTSCSSTSQEATDVTITPLSEATTDTTSPDAASSNGPDRQHSFGDDVETEGSFVFDEGGIETTITMKTVDGIVTEQTTTNVFDYAALGVGSADQAKEALDEIIITVEEMDGFEQHTEYGETQATQVTRVDFEVFDLREAENLPGAMTSGVSEDAVVSYADNRRMLLDLGFVEVE